MASKASLENELRDNVLQVIREALAEALDSDVLEVATGTVVVPCVDSEGNEKYAKVSVTIPRGTRNGDGGYDPYDGYAAAEAYTAEKESKAQEKAVKKAMKEAEKNKKKAETPAEEDEE